jgi:hypothetical protein
VDGYLLWQWMKEETNLEVFTLTLTTTVQQVCAPDPMRCAITVNSNSAHFVWCYFGDGPTAVTQFACPTQALPTVLTREVWGQIITLGFYARVDNATANCGFVTSSFTAHRYGVYRRIMHEYLSKHQSL